jgi:hypothetical protein
VNGIRISLLDSCGGHTLEYHFHQRLRCLYTDSAGHSSKVGVGSDGKAIYGKYENYSTLSVAELDACGGHWGYTPEYPSTSCSLLHHCCENIELI